MNTLLVLLLVWLMGGVLCVILSLWFMQTHEEELQDEIFGCIPPPVKWAVICIMLFFGPLVLLLTVCAAIRESQNEKEEGDTPPAPPAPPPPPAQYQRAWVILFAVIGAPLCAWGWSRECVPKPLDEFWADQARMGALLFFPVLSSVLAGKGPINGLKMPVTLLPLYMVGMVPSLVSMAGAWQGGWIAGLAGVAAGATAGAGMGWLLHRFVLSESDKDKPPSQRRRAIMLPITFAVLLSACGAYTWGVEWAPAEHAWAFGLAWLLMGICGALVGRTAQGLVVMSPMLLVPLVPTAAVLMVGWEGGWIVGIAGAIIGAASGAVQGWSFNRWIMPEYDKRRAQQNAVRGASPSS